MMWQRKTVLFLHVIEKNTSQELIGKKFRKIQSSSAIKSSLARTDRISDTKVL